MGFSPMLLMRTYSLPTHSEFETHLPDTKHTGRQPAGWLAVNGGTLYLRRDLMAQSRIWRELERRGGRRQYHLPLP